MVCYDKKKTSIAKLIINSQQMTHNQLQMYDQVVICQPSHYFQPGLPYLHLLNYLWKSLVLTIFGKHIKEGVITLATSIFQQHRNLLLFLGWKVSQDNSNLVLSQAWLYRSTQLHQETFGSPCGTCGLLVMFYWWVS